MEDNAFIHNLIAVSALSEKDKKFWEEFLRFAHDKHLTAIRAALQVDAKLLPDFTRILKKKLKALASYDENLWYEALNEEQEIIKRYAD